MTARTHRHGARRALTVLAGAVLALGLGSAAAPAAQAADTDADLQLYTGSGTTEGLGHHDNLFIFSVINNGPGSTNWSLTATLTDLIAPDPVIGEQIGDGTCEISGLTVTCAGDALAADDRFTIHLSGEILAYGTGTNTGTVTGDQVDPTPGNETATGNVRFVPAADPELTGDWGTSGSDLMAPGTSKNYDVSFTCLSAGGCDYGPGMTITDRAMNGASYSPGTNNVFINDTTTIGECQVTETDVDCAVTTTGHANQGDVISARTITYIVPEDTAPDTQVFAQTIAFPAGWTGNDPSNDVYPISTPPEVGAPMVSWQVGAGLGGLVLLLGGGALLWRRQQNPQPVAA